MANTSSFNAGVGAWGRETKRKMKLRTLQLVLHVGPGHDNQKVTVRKYLGEANRIQFAFPYYMVYVHKGAGRGYGGTKTGLFTRKNGGKGITRKSSMGRMGTGKRKPKPWFNPVLEERFPALAEIIADYHGGKVMADINKILIK